MNIRIVVLAFVVMGLMLVKPLQAQEMDHCSHEPTVQALQACVTHANEMGGIDQAGIARSLQAKLDSAQRALDRGQSRAAIALVRAFVNEVQAQTGKHIAEPHASHLRMHAETVIAALRQSSP